MGTGGETVARGLADGARSLAYLEPNAKLWEQAGIFAAPVQIASDEPAARLLALSGRTP